MSEMGQQGTEQKLSQIERTQAVTEQLLRGLVDRFDDIEKRFEAHEKIFEAHDHRFRAMETVKPPYGLFIAGGVFILGLVTYHNDLIMGPIEADIENNKTALVTLDKHAIDRIEHDAILKTKLQYVENGYKEHASHHDHPTGVLLELEKLRGEMRELKGLNTK